jgi:RNase P subunit RPR2
MLLQSACKLPAPRVFESESLRRPKCPRCERIVFIAAQSRFNARGQIEHFWSCDDCGEEFVTCVRLSALELKLSIVA